MTVVIARRLQRCHVIAGSRMVSSLSDSVT